jgi:hypothetical protein
MSSFSLIATLQSTLHEIFDPHTIMDQNLSCKGYAEEKAIPPCHM